MLLTDRRRTFGMRDEEDTDRLQGSLFGPDAFTPARPAGPTPDPFAPARAARAPAEPAGDTLGAAAAPPDVIAAAPDLVAPDDLVAPEDLAAPEDFAAGEVALPDEPVTADAAAAAGVAPEVDARVDYADDVDVLPPLDYLDELAPEVVAPARQAAPAGTSLSGPTLDDVMSRVWETMRAHVPAPCPVCHAEVEPSMGGRCGSCGSVLD